MSRFIAVIFLFLSAATYAAPRITIEPIGTYRTGVFDAGAAEIVAYDAGTRRLFVVNAAATTVDVLDIRNPASPQRVATLDASALGASANSVAVKKGLVAVAIEAPIKTDPGLVAFYDARSLRLLKTAPAGALPDMVTFTPDGTAVLVANEGEPNDDYTIDPEGSVTYIDLSRGVAKAKTHQISFTDFNARRAELLEKGVRIFGPNATVAQDLEPEYIAVSEDRRYAWVTLQENNALAKLDLRKVKVDSILSLGSKDHDRPMNAFDASDRDGSINLAFWPVRGLYLPDGIAAYSARGKTYLVTANEGDARDYDGFAEEIRIKDVELDPAVFPDASDLQQDQQIGRLNVTATLGDADADGQYERLFSLGGRSFSIWSADGKLVFDSGRAFEEITGALAAPDFNSDNTENDSFDSRSDNKGPEPEGVVVGEFLGHTYAFIGLERIGGIVVYDVSDPRKPVFQDYHNFRNFLVEAQLEDGSVNPEVGDLGPEGLAFIPWYLSPNFRPLLVVGNEVSGTTTLYEVRLRR